MDAKRIIPILRIRDGRVDGLLGKAVDQARRLELAGADELIFLEEPTSDPAWIREVAGALFIPFSASCVLGAPLEEALGAGVDKAILRVSPEERSSLAHAAQSYGRNRLVVAVDAQWTPRGWRVEGQGPVDWDALEWMVELGQMGAGEILLTAQGDPEALKELSHRLAELPLNVIFRCADTSVGVQTLLHGLDALAYPAGEAAPARWKASHSLAGLHFRT